MCIVVKNLRHFRSTAAFASFFGGCQGQKGTENPLYLFLYRGFCSADAVPQPPGGVYAVRRELCGVALMIKPISFGLTAVIIMQNHCKNKQPTGKSRVISRHIKKFHNLQPCAEPAKTHGQTPPAPQNLLPKRGFVVS